MEVWSGEEHEGNRAGVQIGWDTVTGLRQGLSVPQTRPQANNTKPKRLARPLWAPDLAPLPALGQKPPIVQNTAFQGHPSNVRPEKATEAQPIVNLAPVFA